MLPGYPQRLIVSTTVTATFFVGVRHFGFTGIRGFAAVAGITSRRMAAGLFGPGGIFAWG